jgi:hypothetical protein
MRQHVAALHKKLDSRLCRNDGLTIFSTGMALFSLPRRGYLAQYTPLDLLLNGGWSAVVILCHM